MIEILLEIQNYSRIDTIYITNKIIFIDISIFKLKFGRN
jgi:hypothetical protein